jgi:predicted ABC-type ATPase
MIEKNLYIISGCNGAGKTTASFTILPEILNCKEFVNADEIARGLSPFRPEKVAFESGRIMLLRIEELFEKGESFAIETTLATKIYERKILRARNEGYTIILLFFWLKNIQLAQERVAIRVFEGGHNIESDIISRRYIRGIVNLFDVYLPIIDQAIIFDNSDGKHDLIAEKFLNEDINVINSKKFNALKKYYDERS